MIDKQTIPPEVIEAFGKVDPSKYVHYSYWTEEQRKDWSILFKYYNSNIKGPKLGMACRSCYNKVYLFIKAKTMPA